MFAIQNIKTGKFLYGTDYRYRPPHQRTSNTKMLTYSSIAEAAHDFWVKMKCGMLTAFLVENDRANMEELESLRRENFGLKTTVKNQREKLDRFYRNS